MDIKDVLEYHLGDSQQEIFDLASYEDDWEQCLHSVNQAAETKMHFFRDHELYNKVQDCPELKNHLKTMWDEKQKDYYND